MKISVIFVFAVLFVCVYTHPVEQTVDLAELENETKSFDALEDESVHHREKREPKKKRRGSAEVSVNRDRGGTDVDARVNAHIWQSKNGRSELNGEANYNKHFGGPSGNSRSNYGGGINFIHRF